MLDDIRLRAVIITMLLLLLVSVGVDMFSGSPSQAIIKPEVTMSSQRDTDELFSGGVRLLQEHEYKKSINSFRNVLKDSPRMPEAYSNIGFAHFGLKHYALAAESFTTALDLNPSQVNAYWGLAISFEALCDIPAALGAMRTYVHLAQQDDPYIKKARAAIWEWEQVKAKAATSNGSSSQADCLK